MFDKFFSTNNPIWKPMDTLFDLFVLNSLFVICCIPVITIGPALTAFHYALIQKNLGEGGYISQDFFRSFKQNFKQGIGLGLIMTISGTFLIVDMYLCRKSGTGIYSFFLFFFLVIFAVWFFITLYVFPLLAKFDKSNKDLIIWAFTISIRKIFMTLLMIFMIITGIWITRIIPGLIFIMFGLIGQFCAPFFCSVIKPYITEAVSEESVEPSVTDLSEYGIVNSYTLGLNKEETKTPSDSVDSTDLIN